MEFRVCIAKMNATELIPHSFCVCVCPFLLSGPDVSLTIRAALLSHIPKGNSVLIKPFHSHCNEIISIILYFQVLTLATAHIQTEWQRHNFFSFDAPTYHIFQWNRCINAKIEAQPLWCWSSQSHGMLRMKFVLSSTVLISRGCSLWRKILKNQFKAL